MQTLKDLTAGTAGGIAQVVVGFPFDTVKVRLQTQSSTNPQYAGLTDCVKQVIKQEGFSGFYKGMASPLVGTGVMVAVQYASLVSIKRILASRYDNGLDGLTTTDFAIAGAGAGAILSLICSPVELFKSKLQVQTGSGASAAFKGPMDVASHIVKTQGFKGLLTGLNGTVLREGIGGAAYFIVYDNMKKSFVKPGQTLDDLKPYHLLLSGGVAGIAFWLAVYPIDVAKSRIQVSNEVCIGGVARTLRDIAAKEGIRGWFKGFEPAIIRAFPANAATWMVADLVARFLNKK
ncbi:mitochondrial solute carrier family 25 (mitochondrial carnitine/acylcarnitine transporter) member 20/29 [Andalucia godoyi]|uniref:Mitochondrial solute carrier family 25 (Mitochondrial carnitine/acylcarnitine transporter) member 20/29 n=1 Tax=Andalucia godoyi TaxID=505711 RepID=A0A8K0AHA3_ANDGO|nr:mitochondrial solute carrier family 25 (mitochondrial carnitine/acylcarnitine transporter) member 20/29 [Andalucia godoyi]|eukprot:ANDGO_00487.mRNA.1 mitochondrial solute carrier family 25 (mitochondrial carnitine/acylcarnitine transporter) member 20/29